ncbi:MFS transporter [Methanocaldococcus fervens]|uniref:Major facilitator superfamily MFS_1 n=1 Tax=Methanocaldococcus fervens (strain DSM 4213 / JCM 15782 / AG86) TaxID=573064 RepID=C7P9I9_METFA|nr:MFS transporter [Methanocaldococcus fervens]ACV25221.1 major facilitator superfamily MFS_1 [Methanocaldococcus fervens AG86]
MIKDNENSKKELSKNVYLLGFTSFLNDMSSEMIMPILPMLITSFGGGSLSIGLVGGLRDLISNILMVLVGYYSDKIRKRKIFVVLGYLTSSIFKLLLGLSKTWLEAVIYSSLERMGKGIRTAPRDAIISESMPKTLGKGFGIQRAFDTAGAILGSTLALLFVLYLQYSLNQIVLIAAVIGFLTILPLYFVKEKESSQKPAEISFKFGIKNLSKDLKLFILISGIFTLSNFSYMFYILRAQEFLMIMDERMAIVIPIALYILYNIFYTLFSIPFGILSDKIGRRKVLTLGYMLYGIVSLGFAYFISQKSLILLFALYGIAYASFAGNQKAYVSDLSSEDIRATALGLFYTVVGLTSLPASLIAGYLWKISPEITFLYGGVLAIISSLLLLLFLKD